MSGAETASSLEALERRSSAIISRHGLTLLALFGLLLGGTLLIYFGRLVPYAVFAPDLDEVINASAVVVAGIVAVRAWVRYYETGELDSLLYSSAFLILFLDGLLRVVLQLSGSPLYVSFTLEQPGQAPLYGWTLRRILAAGLLLAAVLTAGQKPHLGRVASSAILFGPALLSVLFSWLALTNESILPTLVTPESLAALLQSGQTFDPAWISASLAATQFLPGVLFGAAAIVALRNASVRSRRGYSLLLAVALMVAAVSQLHYAFVPGVYSSLVPSGDLLRLAFYILALLAVAMATADDLVQLREANEELRRLRAAEAERATALERARIAREIHDGMAQELWLARLTAGSLRDQDLSPEALKTVARLDAVLERALGEARQAIVTLQPSTDERFADLLTRYVDDYADHFGMEIDTVVETERSPDPEQQAELLRICREALSNARKHADPTKVIVSLREADTDLVLTISDNGRGFDRATVQPGFGFETMDQRAHIIKGSLDIDSAPADGTRVSVRIPVTNAAIS